MISVSLWPTAGKAVVVEVVAAWRVVEVVAGVVDGEVVDVVLTEEVVVEEFVVASSAAGEAEEGAGMLVVTIGTSVLVAGA